MKASLISTLAVLLLAGCGSEAPAFNPVADGGGDGDGDGDGDSDADSDSDSDSDADTGTGDAYEVCGNGEDDDDDGLTDMDDVEDCEWNISPENAQIYHWIIQEDGVFVGNNLDENDFGNGISMSGEWGYMPDGVEDESTCDCTIWGGNSTANEAFWVVRVTTESEVWLDTFGMEAEPYEADTILALFDADGNELGGQLACSDEAQWRTSRIMVRHLQPGDYYLVMDFWTSGDNPPYQGEYAINAEFRTPVDGQTDCSSAIDIDEGGCFRGEITSSGETSGSCSGGGFGEDVYMFTVEGDSAAEHGDTTTHFDISRPGSDADDELVIYVRSDCESEAGEDEVLCAAGRPYNQDGHSEWEGWFGSSDGNDYQLPAGTYYAFADGDSGFTPPGPYCLQLYYN